MPPLPFEGFVTSDDTDERDARNAYTTEQLTELFSLPPWTGCRSVSDRFVVGVQRFADALVWVLLLVYFTGVRREEICKLLIDEIDHVDDIWFFEVKNSEAGRIKTSRSRRLIPICDELMRLGFTDYVRAIKTAGHTSLFPELLTESGKSKKGDVFYCLWWPYIKALLPWLREGQALHSARHSFDTELKELDVSYKKRNDTQGRKTVGSGEQDRYAKATRLKTLKPIFDELPIVTAHLAPFTPITLLPAASLKPRPARQRA